MSNRHTVIRLSFSAIIAITLLTVSMLTYAQSEEETEHAAPRGQGTILIEQTNAFEQDTLGKWTLLKPNNEQEVRKDANNTLVDQPAGLYTLFVEPPAGAVASIKTFHGTELLMHVQRPQIAFTLHDGEELRITIHHNLIRTGLVSVQSDPPGLNFSLEGPNKFKTTGTTPASFENKPEGLYQVQYGTLEGCKTPPVESQKLTIDSRASFNFTLECDSADELRDRQSDMHNNNGEGYVTITIDQQDVLLSDVPQNAWFSSFVFNAARLNVLGGYKDDEGKPTGLFGPENNVTVAELAKIAHRLGGVSEESFIGKNPENPGALGTWFSPFIASAESRGWMIYNDATIDPLRPATRAEVIATFMQALDKPLKWQKGQLFSDVTLRTPYAAAIETAAADKIIDGRNNENGNPLHLFAPNDPINRAEIAKMIDAVLKMYIGMKEEE